MIDSIDADNKGLVKLISAITYAEKGKETIRGLSEDDMVSVRAALGLPATGQMVELQEESGEDAVLHRVPFDGRLFHEAREADESVGETDGAELPIPDESLILVVVGPGARKHPAHCLATELDDKTGTLLSVICCGRETASEISAEQAVKIVSDNQVENWLDNLETEVLTAGRGGMFGVSREAMIGMLDPEAALRHAGRLRGLAVDLELISLRVSEAATKLTLQP